MLHVVSCGLQGKILKQVQDDNNKSLSQVALPHATSYKLQAAGLRERS
jgi:hypothetical protein